MQITSIKLDEKQQLTIVLPGSKSISNRMLMINKVGNLNLKFNGLSEANDTVLLNNLLETDGPWDLEDAGAPMRFLLAYAAISGKKVQLDGSPRLRERPVKPLIRSLEKAGAKFKFSIKPNNLPLEIEKGVDEFDAIEVDASASSQFLSALMLSVPMLKGKKTIRIKGELSGVDYVNMTAGLMRMFGVETEVFSQHLHVKEGNYKSQEKKYTIEPDWSSAQYVFMAAALNPKIHFSIAGLQKNSLQGDKEIVQIMSAFGVITSFTEKGIEIKGNEEFELPKNMSFDLQHTPDIAPTIVVLCALKKISAVFNGLDNLEFKESDRTRMLSQNLMKWNIRFYRDQQSWKLDASNPNWKPIKIETANDHRLAMTFAFAATKIGVEIDDIDCVKKSFPGFWEQMGAMLKIGQ